MNGVAGETQSVKHLFWDCPSIRYIWILMSEYCNYEFTYQDIAWLTCKGPHGRLLNSICVLLKNYVYCQKCANTKPSPHSFIRYLEYQERIEAYCSVNQQEKTMHIKKWSLILPELNQLRYQDEETGGRGSKRLLPRPPPIGKKVSICLDDGNDPLGTYYPGASKVP